ncbi:MAG: methyltransferase domain-containing protein [Candidatus Bathyarchaeota archaeon]|nr:methyltransferase domain-containing protein [Candidatus Bathyarchaeota archaeon]
MSSSEYWRIKRETARYYDKIAKIYDMLYRYEQNLKINEILKNFGIKSGGIILDIGCGSGLLFEYIADSSGLIVGADISIGVLRRAKNLVRRRKLRTVDLVRADADFLPFKDHVFDRVFAITMLQNMPNPKLTLKEILRVTKESSEIIITGLKKAFTREIFSRMLAESGLFFILADTGDEVKCHIALCWRGGGLSAPAKNINNRTMEIIS